MCAVVTQGRPSLSCLLYLRLEFRNWREAGKVSSSLDALLRRVGFAHAGNFKVESLGISHEAERCSGGLADL